MPWKRPSIQEIRARVQADLSAELTGPDSSLRRSSNLVIATAVAGGSHALYGRQEYLARQTNAVTAEGVYLERHGRLYGIVPKPAAFAAGGVLFLGDDGTVVPASTTEFIGPTGKIYRSRADVTVVGGEALIIVDAEEAGPESNAPAGTVLTIMSTIDGLQNTGLVDSGAISGGELKESQELFRERILYRKRYPAMGGSQFDYVSWAREVPGVTRAWCFPRYAGANSVGVAFVMDGQEVITPNQAKIDEVAAYIERHTDPVTGRDIGRPVTADVTVFSLTTVPLDLTLSISPDTETNRGETRTSLLAHLRAKAAAGGLLYLSQLRTAIGKTPGVDDYTLTTPSTDLVYQPTEIPVLGEITWL